jgi:hypothetical protein
VKSFPANMLNLAPQRLKDVVEMDMQPMSLAVYTTAVSNCVNSLSNLVSAAIVVLSFTLH